MNIEAGKKLLTAREKRGWTQQVLAEKVGFSTKQLQKYEYGNFPTYKSEKVKEIDSILGTNLYQLVYEQNVPHETYTEHRRNLKNNHKNDVPMYSGYTTLGNIEIIDDENVKHKVMAHLPAEVFPGCDYAEKAQGDSMHPVIQNQAILAGKTCPVKGIVFGEKYIIKTRHGLDTTKYIHPGADETKFCLKAYNKNIPDQQVEIDDIVFSCRVKFIINPT